MQFALPQVLWALGPAVLLLAAFLGWAWRRRQQLRTRFIQARLLPQLTVGLSPRRELVRSLLLLLAVTALLLSLARPQWGFAWEEARQRGLDIVVAIDTSRSMLAEDLAPNRLARAKLAALDLLRLARTDRLGLVAFAGTAFLQCPLTLDDEAFRQSVEALDPAIIPQGGTAIAAAIQTALGAFKDENNFKILVLFSDGEDHDGQAAAAASKAAQVGLRLFTVGMGTPSGEVLRLTDANGNPAYLKDNAGNVVKSRLNEALLQEIATVTQGFYLPFRGANVMDTLYEQGLAPLPKTDTASRLVRRYHERYYLPLALAILALLAELLLPAAPRRATLATQATSTRTAAATALLGLLLLGSSPTAQASAAQARRLYDEGRFAEAQKAYENLLEKAPTDERLRFNSGTAAYRAGRFAQAAQSFTNALRSPDLTLQQQSFYNLGNTLYQLGSQTTELNQKRVHWQEALRNFEAALQLNPKDEDARANLEFVRRQLEELPKPPPQPQENQKPQDQSAKDEPEQPAQDQAQSPGNKPSPQDPKPQEPPPSPPNAQPDAQSPSPSSPQSGSDKAQPPSQPPTDPSQPEASEANRAQQQTDSQSSSAANQPGQAAETNGVSSAATKPGQMTAAQALQLLESQEGETRVFVFGPPPTNRPPERHFKDW